MPKGCTTLAQRESCISQWSCFKLSSHLSCSFYYTLLKFCKVSFNSVSKRVCLLPVFSLEVLPPVPGKMVCINSHTYSFDHHLFGQRCVRTRGREGWDYPWVTQNLYQQGGHVHSAVSCKRPPLVSMCFMECRV